MARPDIVRMVRMVISEPVVLCRGECEPSEVTELDTRPDICNTFSIFIKTKVNTSGGPHQHSKQSQNLKHWTLPSKHFMFVKKLSQCQCTQHSVLVSSQFFLTWSGHTLYCIIIHCTVLSFDDGIVIRVPRTRLRADRWQEQRLGQPLWQWTQHLSESKLTKVSSYIVTMQWGFLIRRLRWQDQNPMMTLNFTEWTMSKPRTYKGAIY